MICSTGIAGGSLVMCEDVSWREAFVLAESEDTLEGTTVPGGGGGNGPRCWAAKGTASKAHATIKSAFTPIFMRFNPAMAAPIILWGSSLSYSLYSTRRFDASNKGFVVCALRGSTGDPLGSLGEEPVYEAHLIDNEQTKDQAYQSGGQSEATMEASKTIFGKREGDGNRRRD